MTYKNKYLRKQIDYYKKARKQLNKNLFIIIKTHRLEHVALIDTSDEEVLKSFGLHLSYAFIARTMEYIQGLKYDTEKIIEELKKELEEYETNQEAD